MTETGPLKAGVLLAERYRLTRVLGTGGMATVWEAEDSTTANSVAVKVLSDTLAHDADYVQRFQREAEISAEFEHPHLVSVLDHDSKGGRPFLTMELVGGGTLAEALERGDTPDAELVGIQLLDALEHMHEAGIVHRDIKPANVLIADDGTLKLTDFGIARGIDATRYTQTGQVIGTLKYLAPELIKGEAASPRSDLYALGVLLEDCGGTSASPALAGLIQRLRAEDPSNRPGSAAAARASLDDPTDAMATAPLPGEPTAVLPPAVIPAAGTDAAASPTAQDTVEVAVTPKRMVLAAAAVIAVVLAVLAFGGSDDPSSAEGQGKELASPLIDTTRIEDTPPTPAPEPAPEPEPAPAQPTSNQFGCDTIDARKDQLDEREKAAKDATDDKDAEKAVKEAFKQREEKLKDREDACKDEEKAAEEAAKEAEESDEDSDEDGD